MITSREGGDTVLLRLIITNYEIWVPTHILIVVFVILEFGAQPNHRWGHVDVVVAQGM